MNTFMAEQDLEPKDINPFKKAMTGSKDSKTAMYNALITLKSDNDLDQEEFASQIEHMSGIISAQLI